MRTVIIGSCPSRSKFTISNVNRNGDHLSVTHGAKGSVSPRLLLSEENV